MFRGRGELGLRLCRQFRLCREKEGGVAAQSSIVAPMYVVEKGGRDSSITRERIAERRRTAEIELVRAGCAPISTQIGDERAVAIIPPMR